MKTVREISKISGVSIRTLRDYDEIGLLKPTRLTASGYRLYDQRAQQRLQHILFLRELKFPLSQIQILLDSPDGDRRRALLAHRALLERRRRRIDGLIALITDVAGDALPSFESLRREDIQAILRRALSGLSKSSIDAIERKYGGVDAFRGALFQALSDEEAQARFIHLYGSREKLLNTSNAPLAAAEPSRIRAISDRLLRQFADAMSAGSDVLAMSAVAQCAEACQRALCLTNARALLLQIAENPQGAQPPDLNRAIESQFFPGLSQYIAQSIRTFYGA